MVHLCKYLSKKVLESPLWKHGSVNQSTKEFLSEGYHKNKNVKPAKCFEPGKFSHAIITGSTKHCLSLCPSGLLHAKPHVHLYIGLCMSIPISVWPFAGKLPNSVMNTHQFSHYTIHKHNQIHRMLQ